MRQSIVRIAGATGLIALALSLGGCGRVVTKQGYVIDQPLVDSIQPGIDNKASVEGTLGRPTFAGQFTDNDWYYVSRRSKQLAFNSPTPAEQTILHVKFDGAGNVTGIEKTGLETVRRVNPVGDKTPTLGRNRTLFQEVFGNIGAVGAAGAGAPTGGAGAP